MRAKMTSNTQASLHILIHAVASAKGELDTLRALCLLSNFVTGADTHVCNVAQAELEAQVLKLTGTVYKSPKAVK